MRTLYSPDAPPPKGFYTLLTASVTPRPIAWISSLSADGVRNLAPYSFFTVASGEPPILSVTSLGHKDSWRNIRDTGEFVVNIGTESLMEVMNETSAPLPADVDEFEVVGVHAEASDVVAAPRVAEAPIAFECRRHDIIEVGNGTLLLGEVVSVAVDDDVLAEDGLPDFGSLLPPSRLGRLEWGYAPQTRWIARPKG
ncbi:flavin reductase family protein [Dietzia cercidiphylli]|uniref:flavin reductase family protein n=1 Tax=Dietzia cercidiphylli TaxID=498199 RepID=UPI00223B8848|nr:flavin reductase family protein [Dietzia cercidiphylli]MCT1514536.1 flavin reductase family protein [Dietzia cercidiphylli]